MCVHNTNVDVEKCVAQEDVVNFNTIFDRLHTVPKENLTIDAVMLVINDIVILYSLSSFITPEASHTHNTSSTNTIHTKHTMKHRNNEKSAQRDANTARALL